MKNYNINSSKIFLISRQLLIIKNISEMQENLLQLRINLIQGAYF